MKLTKRGERVFAISLLISALVGIGSIGLGVNFLMTHERVTDQSSCRYSIDAGGMMCDFTWEAK
jgi:hypothetical protein